MLEITINDETRSIDIDPATPLLWVIREQFQLTGTKFGCGIAQCGACTVHIDGTAVRSCVTPIGSITGKRVNTIESIAKNGELHPVQQAWIDEQVPQCGYCQSGQIMSALALLEGNANPTDEDIDQAMRGNICRCGTYSRIRSAIKSAIKRAASGEVLT